MEEPSNIGAYEELFPKHKTKVSIQALWVPNIRTLQLRSLREIKTEVFASLFPLLCGLVITWSSNSLYR